MNVPTLTIVGVGLIGGSIGLAAKRRGVAGRVLGVGHRQTSLDKARAVGAIDEGFLNLADAVRHADFVVFCTPVEQIAGQVLVTAADCKPGAILTDAGSTKSAIVRAVEAVLPSHVSFVGGHPVAGSEKKGPEHADADLFQDRLTVVTRTERTDPQALAAVQSFWEALGSKVKVMTPEEHDRALATTSHLPHLLASALAGILPPELCELAGTGFGDTTRVASGDPSIWTGIFRQNRAALLDSLNLLSARLTRFQAALKLDDRDAIDALLTQAKKVRDALGS